MSVEYSILYTIQNYLLVHPLYHVLVGSVVLVLYQVEREALRTYFPNTALGNIYFKRLYTFTINFEVDINVLDFSIRIKPL